jgi:hypothetical protein
VRDNLIQLALDEPTLSLRELECALHRQPQLFRRFRGVYAVRSDDGPEPLEWIAGSRQRLQPVLAEEIQVVPPLPIPRTPHRISRFALVCLSWTPKMRQVDKVEPCP